MTGRVLLLAIAVLTLALAGCLGQDGGPDGAPAASPVSDEQVGGPTQGLSFFDCAHHEAFWFVPYEEVAGLVPEPLVATPMGADQDLGAFFVTAFSCPETTLPGNGPATALWAGIQVDPPEDAEAAPDFNGYLLGSFHTEPGTAEVFEAWGQGQVEVAEVRFEDTGIEDQGHGISAAGPVEVETVAPAEAPPRDLLHARFWTVENGSLHGAMDLEAVDHDVVAGAGDIRIDGSLWGMSQPTPVVPEGIHGDIGTLAFSWWTPDEQPDGG